VSKPLKDGPRRVLLVEDDPDVRAIVEIALADLGGMEVATCATCTEALRRLKTEPADVLLLDLSLPDMEGSAIVDALWEGYPEDPPPPVVFLTASPDRAKRVEATYRGVIGVVGKPFDPIGLADQIRSMWREWARARDQRSRG